MEEAEDSAPHNDLPQQFAGADASALANIIAREPIGANTGLAVRAWAQRLISKSSEFDYVAAGARFHSNGFIKVQLGTVGGRRTRLHIWERDTASVARHIHDHTADFASLVLIGAIDEDLYELDSSSSALYGRVSYPSHEQADGPPIILGPVSVRLTGRAHHSAGSLYAREFCALHSTGPAVADTITIVRFGQLKALRTTVLFPMGDDWPVVAQRQSLVGRLWRALVMLSNGAG